MKKLILALAVAGFITQAQAQTPQKKLETSSIPAAVTTAFNQSHQTVKDVEWRLVDGNNYLAEFDEGKTDMYLNYDAKGNLTETKMEIAGASLPAPVMTYVKQNYKEDEVRKAYKMTDADGVVTYKAKVKDMHLLFDADGTFIKSVSK